jgi:tetratricopeptide (TPR) repeat protein
MRAADVQEAEKLLKTRQDLPYAYRTIGEVLFERGLYGEALGYIKRALGDDRDAELEWKLQYCQDEVRRRENKLQVCPKCLLESSQKDRTCPRCGHYLGVRVKGLGGGAPILGGFLLLCGMGVLVWLGILLSASTPSLCVLAVIPLAVVVVIRRRSLTGFLRGVEKLD